MRGILEKVLAQGAGGVLLESMSEELWDLSYQEVAAE